MAEFFSMGGYGAYIWPAYLITFAVLAGMVIFSRRANAKEAARLVQLEKARGE